MSREELEREEGERDEGRFFLSEEEARIADGDDNAFGVVCDVGADAGADSVAGPL